MAEFTITNGDPDEIINTQKELIDLNHRKYGTTNPIMIAYHILQDCYLEQNAEPMHAIEEALGYLGEALDE